MSGTQRTFQGTFSGTGASLNIDTVGFKPTRVVLINVTGLSKLEWIAPMADASGSKEATAGDKTFITTGGITPRPAGFNLGTDAFNGAGNVIHFEARE